MTVKINFCLALSVGILAIATTACNNEPTQTVINPVPVTSQPIAKAEDLPLVVATNSVSCGLARQIAGDTINLKCLIEAGTDPHVYQPNPEDRKAIDSAKLVLYGGYDFEPSVIKLIKASSNPTPKIAVNEVAVPTPLMAEDGHGHDHDKEDKKTTKEADPHVWHNAENGIKIVKVISKNLTALRPDQVDFYAKNTAKVVTELEQLQPWIKAQIATIPAARRKLVTTHDALGYYSKAYNIPLEGALGRISTEEQPTASRIKELVKIIKATKVPTIFAEVTINPKLITAVAKEAGVKVSERELIADGLDAKGTEGETYTGMMVANTRTIVEGLGGKYTPFQVK